MYQKVSISELGWVEGNVTWGRWMRTLGARFLGLPKEKVASQRMRNKAQKEIHSSVRFRKGLADEK